MNFDIDLTSLLAGISLTAIAGWIASFIAFRKDERAVQFEQVTKERTKWRDNMRMLCEEIAMAHFENRASAIPAKVASLRARLATSINPKDIIHDGEILAHYDRLFSGESDDLKVFTHRIALLLKHDWERVKWECTPLYIKPFKYFTKKQRELRQENYRETDFTLTIDNQRSKTPIEKEKTQAGISLPKFIGVRPEDVTLKFIFDNIRNYGIAATVIIVGLYLCKYEAQAIFFPCADAVLGILFIVAGIVLHGLNLCQGILVLLKANLRFFAFFILGIIIGLGTSGLLVATIFKGIHSN